MPGSATVNNFQKTFHLQNKDVSEGLGHTSPLALGSSTLFCWECGRAPSSPECTQGWHDLTPCTDATFCLSILGHFVNFGE